MAHIGERWQMSWICNSSRVTCNRDCTVQSAWRLDPSKQLLQVRCQEYS